MDHLTQTLENCREFLRICPHIEEGYEHFDSGSGFSCTLRSGFHAKLRVEHLRDRSDHTLRYVVLEVYPGITVGSSYISIAAEYLQQVLNGPSRIYIGVNPSAGYVYAHCAVCFRDNPVTAQVLSQMLDDAVALLSAHAPTLRHLACGRLPPLSIQPEQNPAPGKPLTEPEQRLVARSRDAIADYLRRVHPATSGFRIGTGREDCFFAEVFAGSGRYQVRFRIHAGWLTLAACNDIRSDPACRTQVARYINHINDGKKIGHLALAGNGRIYAAVSTYLPGGSVPISAGTLEEMENLVILLLRTTEKQLVCLAGGALPLRQEDSDCPDSVPNLNVGAIFREILHTLPEDEPDSDILARFLACMAPEAEANTAEPARPVQTRQIGFARESETANAYDSAQAVSLPTMPQVFRNRNT